MQDAAIAEFDMAERARKFRATLEDFGFPRLPVWRRTWCAATCLTVILLAFAALLHMKLGFERKDATITVVALFTLAFAFHQWRMSRTESSLDKFYERLAAANSNFDKLEGCDKYMMFMFTELDNLEYIIHKYCRTYISDELAFRALRTFYIHCRDIQHADKSGKVLSLASLANDWVKRAGYMEPTRIVVENICLRIADLSKGTQSPAAVEIPTRPAVDTLTSQHH